MIIRSRLACTSAPARSFERPRQWWFTRSASTRFSPLAPYHARSLSRVRARERQARRGEARRRVVRAARAEPRGDALIVSRIELGRAAPSGAERDRAPGSSGAEGPAVAATRASSTTPPERVCACVRVSLRFTTSVLRSVFLFTRTLLCPAVRSRRGEPKESSVVVLGAHRQRQSTINRNHHHYCLLSSFIAVYVSCRVCTPHPSLLARARAWTTRAHEPTRI